MVAQREEVAMALAAHDGQEEQGQVLAAVVLGMLHVSDAPRTE